MPTVLIKHWKYAVIVALFVSTASFFGLWRYSVLAHEQTKKDLVIAEQKITSHEKNIEIAERINNDYQANIDRLNADIRRLRNRPAKCITITTAPDIHPRQGQGGEHDRKNGISSGWLYDYAFEAEQIRIERNACKDFVNEVWESKK